MAEDIFDSIFALEQEFTSEGHREGVERGKKLGLQEGEELGLVKGFEIGSELGFYEGCCLAWKAINDCNEGVGDRAWRHLSSLEEMIKQFPQENLLNEDLVARLQQIRAKFKVTAATMRSRVVFDEEELRAAKDQSF